MNVLLLHCSGCAKQVVLKDEEVEAFERQRPVACFATPGCEGWMVPKHVACNCYEPRHREHQAGVQRHAGPRPPHHEPPPPMP